MAKFSLAWEAHKQNICNGLTALQQNGEFVDMTLAADGHHVKVHQMVISLASPYLKDIITSFQTPHPVIFLNKVSFPMLSAILEYIYTGEVLIDKDSIMELLETAKELHIKGLEDMTFELNSSEALTKTTSARLSQGQSLSELINKVQRAPGEDSKNDISQASDTEYGLETPFLDAMDTDHETYEVPGVESNTKRKANKDQPETPIQYTISNQGALQMILNRCLYCLRYTSVRGPSGGHRQWRCVDYNRRKCPATAITKNDVVVKRFSAHNHPFHDSRILKKVGDNAVFSNLTDAVAVGQHMKEGKSKNVSIEKSQNTVTGS